MKITATSIYDWKAFRALKDAIICKGKNPVIYNAIRNGLKKLMIMVIVLFCLSALNEKIPSPVICIAILLCSFGLVTVVDRVVSPWVNHKIDVYRNGLIKNYFIFNEDSMFIESQSEKQSSSGRIKYTSLLNVLETSKYIFLFVNPRFAYVIDKLSIENGGVEAVRSAMQTALGEKYKIANY